MATNLELLFSEAKAKRTECLRQVGLLNAKADAFKETMDSLETAISKEVENNDK